MGHRYSLAFLTVFDLGPVEAVRVAAETGYDLVGLRLLPAAASGEPDYPIMTDDRLLAETAAAIRDTGIGVADVEIVAAEAGDRRGGPSRPSSSAAQRLGARNVLVAGDDPEEARLTESFAALARLAAGFGLTVDLEFMPWTKVPDLAAARRIVEAAGRGERRRADRRAALRPLGDDARRDRRDAGGADQLRPVLRRAGRLRPERRRADRGGAAGAADAGRGRDRPRGLARAIPADAVISVEIPNHALAERLGPAERAALALRTTRAVVEAARPRSRHSRRTGGHDMRIAVIGAGAIGLTHCRRHRRDRGLRARRHRRSVRRGRGAGGAVRRRPTTATTARSIEAERPDGAIVATPNETHLPIALDCLAAGVPVIVEKPLANTPRRGRGSCSPPSGAAGLPVLVGHHRRHHPVRAAGAGAGRGGRARAARLRQRDRLPDEARRLLRAGLAADAGRRRHLPRST